MDVMLNLMFYGFMAIFDAPHKRVSPLMINLNTEFYLNKAPYTSRSHVCVSQWVQIEALYGQLSMSDMNNTQGSHSAQCQL